MLTPDQTHSIYGTYPITQTETVLTLLKEVINTVLNGSGAACLALSAATPTYWLSLAAHQFIQNASPADPYIPQNSNRKCIIRAVACISATLHQIHDYANQTKDIAPAPVTQLLSFLTHPETLKLMIWAVSMNNGISHAKDSTQLLSWIGKGIGFAFMLKVPLTCVHRCIEQYLTEIPDFITTEKPEWDRLLTIDYICRALGLSNSHISNAVLLQHTLETSHYYMDNPGGICNSINIEKLPKIRQRDRKHTIQTNLLPYLTTIMNTRNIPTKKEKNGLTIHTFTFSNVYDCNHNFLIYEAPNNRIFINLSLMSHCLEVVNKSNIFCLDKSRFMQDKIQVGASLYFSIDDCVIPNGIISGKLTQEGKQLKESYGV